MTLGKTQELFMRLLPRLIDKAHELGFEIRGGDLFRDPRVHGEAGKKKGYGNRFSSHKLKLAIDLNLFKDGTYMTRTQDHEELGVCGSNNMNYVPGAVGSTMAIIIL